jgi:hypothetical protein
MKSLKETARQAAMRDISKVEGNIAKYRRFVGKSGYKSEGYNPVKHYAEGKIFDPSDAPFDYNFLTGFCVRDSFSPAKFKF